MKNIGSEIYNIHYDFIRLLPFKQCNMNLWENMWKCIWENMWNYLSNFPNKRND